MSTLSPHQHQAAWRRLGEERFDVLVVGGGVTGCGVALDAATRGLRVALVEQDDVASGTSSRSSKMIHGGLRYLEQGDVGLVREALGERRRLLTTLCPHLVTPIPFMYPLFHPVWERLYMGAGLAVYDLLGGGRALPRHRHLTRRQTLAAAPALAGDDVAGAIVYWDAQVDDARHTVELARTATRHGAAVATHARMSDLLVDDGSVIGAVVDDRETGERVPVRAEQVVYAAGAWTNQLPRASRPGQPAVRPSKGVHLVVPRDRIPGDTAMILRTERSVLLLIPWQAPPDHHHWLVGTTDTGWSLDPDEPVAHRGDVDYLLGEANRVLRTPLTRDDLDGVYAGLRPLADATGSDTATASREHVVRRPAPGLVAVTGGKYTTYRVMAADAVDAAASGLPQRVCGSRTADTPLLGARGLSTLLAAREGIAGDTGLALAWVDHLLKRYGSLTAELLDEVAAQPGLGRPIPGAPGYLQVEARYAASHEGARHLDDVLARRTRIAMETADRGVEAAEAVAPLMGEVLGWDEDTRAGEVQRYRAGVAAQRAAEDQPDDRSAAGAWESALTATPRPTPPARR